MSNASAKLFISWNTKAIVWSLKPCSFSSGSLALLSALLFGGKVKVNPAHPKQIGSIDPHCRVSDVIRGETLSLYCCTWVSETHLFFLLMSFKLCVVDAYENARNLCDRYYMNSPELLLEEFNGNWKIIIQKCLLLQFLSLKKQFIKKYISSS